MEDTETPAYEPLRLERLTLPSGGWVSFNDPEDLTGRDVRKIRKALDADGQGTATNNFYETAMVMLIAAWEIPYAPGLKLPCYDKSNKQESTGSLKARDLRAIERHLSPVLAQLAGGGDTDEDDQTPR